MINTVETSSKNIKIWIILIFICLFIAISQYANYLPNLEDDINQATSIQPESFTELRFDNSATLPKVIEPNETYEFSFTVRDVEHQNMVYPYQVSKRSGNQEIVLDQGNLNLMDGMSETINEKFGPLENSRTQILVKILNTNQSIDFWMQKQ